MGTIHAKIMTDILSAVCSMVRERNFCNVAAYSVQYRHDDYRNAT